MPLDFWLWHARTTTFQPSGEEWVRGLAVGCATLVHGSEIWPWGQSAWADEAEIPRQTDLGSMRKLLGHDANVWSTGRIQSGEMSLIRAVRFLI